MKNKNGFTLVELLSVIVILGVVLAIAVPAVTSQINKSKNQYYKTMEQSVKTAAMEYFNDNLMGLMQEGNICYSSIVPNYIDSVKGSGENENSCKTYIHFKRNGIDNYTFTPYISCDKYETDGFNDGISCVNSGSIN